MAVSRVEKPEPAPKPQQYLIATGVSREKLILTVQAATRQGWRCQGGITIDAGGMFHQAMVKD